MSIGCQAKACAHELISRNIKVDARASENMIALIMVVRVKLRVTLFHS
jgi:hypothetical protein